MRELVKRIGGLLGEAPDSIIQLLDELINMLKAELDALEDDEREVQPLLDEIESKLVVLEHDYDEIIRCLTNDGLGPAALARLRIAESEMRYEISSLQKLERLAKHILLDKEVRRSIIEEVLSKLEQARKDTARGKLLRALAILKLLDLIFPLIKPFMPGIWPIVVLKTFTARG